MLLDTGAIVTIVQPELLASIGFTDADAQGTIEIVTATRSERIRRFTIRRFDALGETLWDMPVYAHNLPPMGDFHGLLGLDFFRDRRLTLDFRSGILDLR
jgi:hypothetical protein